VLLAIAAFGLIVPNGLFIYWLFVEFDSLSALLANRLALAFIIDGGMATGLLAYLFAKRPPGAVRWPWFVVLTLLGGLGFSIPFYLWWNFKRSGSRARSVGEWWRRLPSP
jgi:hypothetical protein